MNPIGVLGAGSWGTALAIHAVSTGATVRLWGRDRELVEALILKRRNPKYLPDAEIPEKVLPTDRLADLKDCDPVMIVIPSHALREVVREFLVAAPSRDLRVMISATKGIETESLCRMSEVVGQEADTVGVPIRFASLSGPSFAAELAAGQPTAAVIASQEEVLARQLGERLSTPRFRLYSSSDVIGVELGGAAKNVIAIGAGILSGLGLGQNTQAALITRGLHEITRLGVAAGGSVPTFSGLAGLGDLVLTCTGGLSRNRRTGIELARGRSLNEIQKDLGMVAEGIRNSLSLTRLARRLDIEMPITEQMMQVMYKDKSPARAVEDLMTRALKAEAEL